MRPRPGRTSPGTCQGFMGCRPVGREREDAGHTARSCFVWPRHLQRVTYLLAYGWAYSKRAEGPSVLPEPAVSGSWRVLFYSGDEADAKAEVRRIIDRTGHFAVD